MKILSKLSLENCWSYPDSDIAYLDKGVVNLELKNNSNKTIEITKVLLQFQTEEGLRPYVASNNSKIGIDPHNLFRIQIPFCADLSLTHYTNSYSIKVISKHSGKTESITFRNTPSNYLIIHSVRPIKKHFFISHKDPQDTELAKKMERYLNKIGFKGFLAEEHKQPGIDIWKHKIIPAIDNCVALIVTWTSKAKISPSSILREVRYAKKKKMKFLVLADHNAKLHNEFLGNKEYVRCKNKISEIDIINFVTSIEKAYKKGGYDYR